MKRSIKYISVLAAALAMNGCVKDDTVDSFAELNEVTIGELNEKYTVRLYDTLQIPLDIKTSLDDDSHLSYAWYLYTKTSRFKADTISREKDLDVLIDPTKAVPGEDYTLGIKVTDETTGVYYRKNMKLEVTTLFTKGTVMLCKENGKAELNFLVSGGGDELIENVYSRSNGGRTLEGTPLAVYAANPNPYQPMLKQMLVFCEEENGGVITDPVTFEEVKTVRKAIDTDLKPGILSPRLYFMHQMNSSVDYILMDGKVCKRGYNMGLMDWEAPLVCTEGPADYEVAPRTFMLLGMQTFFDRKHSRFLQHAEWNMGALHQISTANADLSRFDPNNLGENMDMICCGNQQYPFQAWTLMKDNSTGKYYIYKFAIPRSGIFTPQLKLELTPAIAPHIGEALHFAQNIGWKKGFDNILMYATADKVYSISLNLLDEGTSSNMEVCQVDLSEKNMEITGFEFANIIMDSRPSGSLQLRLYVRDNNLTGLKGGVAFYEVSTSGGLHSDFLYSRTGFCDEVVDVDEKYS